MGTIAIDLFSKEGRMYFFEWYLGLFTHEIYRGVALVAVCVCVAVFAILSACLKSKATYFALTFCLLGCYDLALMAYEHSLQAALACNLTVGIVVCVCFLCLLFVFWLREKHAQKQRRFAEKCRDLKYTVPDRENNYVRTRLQTTLSHPHIESAEIKDDKTPILHLEYVKKLLVSIRNAPLSMTERLETEDMATLFNAYLCKSKWTAEDVRAVNDLFSRLLKLSAKYAV